MYSESEIKQLIEENKALKEQNAYLTEQIKGVPYYLTLTI